VAPTAETVIGSLPEEEATTVDISKGDPAAGKEIFTEVAQPACSSCHTFTPAGSTQTLGPNLDTALAGKDANFVLESIIEPDAEITPGFPDNLMPEDYGEKLDQQQLTDLIAFLLQKS
jgi:mono/diheme cytochrome c family protein